MPKYYGDISNQWKKPITRTVIMLKFALWTSDRVLPRPIFCMSNTCSSDTLFVNCLWLVRIIIILYHMTKQQFLKSFLQGVLVVATGYYMGLVFCSNVSGPLATL